MFLTRSYFLTRSSLNTGEDAENIKNMQFSLLPSPYKTSPGSAMSSSYNCQIPKLAISAQTDQVPPCAPGRHISLRLLPSHEIARLLRSAAGAGGGLRLLVIEPVAAARSSGHWPRRRKFPPPSKATAECCSAEEGEEVERSTTSSSSSTSEKKKKRMEVAAAAAATVVLGTANRVLYKLALVPLKDYPFFLAQLATFGYVLVYFTILRIRYNAGIITDEMLSIPKTAFLIVGLLEALGAASGMAAGGALSTEVFISKPIYIASNTHRSYLFNLARIAVLSAASIPILSQTFLVWQLLLSAIFLGRRYRFNQILGCCLVSIGVIITVTSGGSGGGVSLIDAGMFWTLLMVTSFLFQAADTVLKEIIFLDSAKKLKGGSVDLFVVNSYGSAFQALFICLLMPFLSKLWGVPFSQLPNYVRDGTACFLNIGSASGGCQGAPLLPILFVLVNMAFNISLLHLLKISSAVVSCLASTFSVPLSIYAFTLPLPYIGVASTLPTGYVMGATVLFAGLLSYCWTPPRTPSTQQPSV